MTSRPSTPRPLNLPRESSGNNVSLVTALMVIAGAPTFGPKRADLALSKVKSSSDYWPTVVAAYESVGCTKEDALRNLRLARILAGIGLGQRKPNPDSL